MGRWKPPVEATENVASEPEVMPALPEEGGTVSMPEAVDDEAPPLDVPGDLTPWGIFLASLSAETRELVPEEELRASFEAVGKKARDARRQQLKAAAVAKAERQARHLAGLVTAEELSAEQLAERNNRRVRWTVQIPFMPETGGTLSDGLCIDGRTFYHGQEVETSWAEWRSCLSIIWNMRQHELDFKGESRLSSLRRMNAEGAVGVSVR